MAQQKKGQQQKKKGAPSNAQRGSQKDHQAQGKDTAQVLKRAVQSSGLHGAEIVAKKLDEQGRQGTSTLKILMTCHQELNTETGKLAWVPNPAEWMRDAMESDERRKPMHLVTGRALSRKMRRLRLKQLEMKKNQPQPPAQA